MKAEAYPVLLGAVLGFSIAPALAQGTPGNPAGNQTIPEKMPKGEKGTTTDQGESLSDKLDASGGVIKPPQGVDPDPGISKPAPVPDPHSTPVIPPPGTPGGPAGSGAKMRLLGPSSSDAKPVPTFAGPALGAFMRRR